jgi:hypothetical protein
MTDGTPAYFELSSCLTSAARWTGIGVARASY